jgi:hypothetical protein
VNGILFFSLQNERPLVAGNLSDFSELQARHATPFVFVTFFYRVNQELVFGFMTAQVTIIPIPKPVNQARVSALVSRL